MAYQNYRQQSLEPTEEYRSAVCPHCGAKIHPGGRFCSECGRPLLSEREIKDILLTTRNQAKQYENNKKYEKALQCLLDVLPLGESDPIFLNLTGLEYYYTGNLEKALEYYTKANACNRSEALYWFNIAMVYHDLKKYEEAAFFYKGAIKVLKMHPNDNIAGRLYKNYARLLGTTGDYSGLKEYLRLAEKNGESKEECDRVWTAFR